MTSILRACANARTSLRSARLSLTPEAVSFQTPTTLLAGLFSEGAQIAFMSGTGLVGGGYPAIQRGRLSQLNPSHQTPRKRPFRVAECWSIQNILQRGQACRRPSPRPVASKFAVRGFSEALREEL